MRTLYAALALAILASVSQASPEVRPHPHPFEDAAATRAHIRARLREIMGRDHGLLENTQEPTPNRNLTVAIT